MAGTERKVVSAYFLLLLAVGVASFRSYGVPWDEPRQRLIGGVSARYVWQTLAPDTPAPVALPERGLADFDDRDYGVVFEAPAVALELLLGLTDTRDVYFMRHLLTYLVFLAGTYALYRMAARRFDDWRIGLLAATFLVLSPRFFAEGFYNSKDVVFMALFAIATNTMLAFLARPSWPATLAHALATAVAIDLRIVAIVLVPMTLVLIAVEAAKGRVDLRGTLPRLAVFLVVTAGLVVLMFPWLWEDPAGRFLDTVRQMANFQRFSDRVRYMGGSIMPDDLPWHYLPVWIAITTPVLYLGLFAIGAVAVVARGVSRHVRLWADAQEMQDLVFLALVLAPLLAIMTRDTIVYDGWRHVYFVYPAFLMLAMRGWSIAWRAAQSTTALRLALLVATAASLVVTAVWMVRVHPMQNVYFNRLAGHDWQRYYEVDYWGLGNRTALEYVLTHDTSARFSIKAESSTPIENATLALRPEDRARVQVVSKDEPARYILTNYRGVDVDAADGQPNRDLVYRLTVDGEPIVSVYRVRGE